MGDIAYFVVSFMKSAIIIDGHNFLFKSFAVPFKFYSKRGIPLHVIVTFISLVRRAVTLSKGGTNIMVVFDYDGVNHNNAIDRDYKRNRITDYTELGDSPFKHLPYIKKVLTYLTIKWVESKGVEADDIIASAVRKYQKLKYNTIVVSTDSDFFQLINVNCLVLRIKTKYSVEYCDLEWFRCQYGFEPSRYPVWKAYVGDKGDNIKGISGIGTKRATEILLNVRKVTLSPEQEVRFLKNVSLITLRRDCHISIANTKINYERLSRSNINIIESCEL